MRWYLDYELTGRRWPRWEVFDAANGRTVGWLPWGWLAHVLTNGANGAGFWWRNRPGGCCDVCDEKRVVDHEAGRELGI